MKSFEDMKFQLGDRVHDQVGNRGVVVARHLYQTAEGIHGRYELHCFGVGLQIEESLLRLQREAWDS